MTKRTWQSADDLATPASGSPVSAIASRDEFGPEVARAIADLRARHGHESISCQPEGNTADAVSALRGELQTMLPGVNRRGFLRLTGAAAVFALAACNEKHPDTLVPYATVPEGRLLGETTWYSTLVRDAGHPVAIMAKSYEGRPIKLEGNPDCPVGRGRADARTQAALVNLYDPDRLQLGPVAISKGQSSTITWADLDAKVGASLVDGGVGLITGPVDGPASRQLIEDLRGAFGARFRHVLYQPITKAIEFQARQVAFGAQATPAQYQVGKAAVLVTLGSDLLGEGTLADHIGFGDLRALKGEGAQAWMGQVIACEPNLSQTGASADIRVRVGADRLAHLGWALAAAVGAKLGVALPAGIVPASDLGLAPITVAGKDVDPVAFIAGQLLAAKAAGRASLVYVGGAAHAAPASLPLHLAAVWLNSVLGNEGVTVVAGPGSAIPDTAAIYDLAQACQRGEIKTLIIRDANPVYAWPAFAETLAKVGTVVVLADRIDETAVHAHYVAPTLHGLEAWGDAELAAGVVALQQPVIQRLWDARAAEESLFAFAVAALGDKVPAGFAQTKGQATPIPAVVSRTPVWQPLDHGVQSWHAFVQAVWLAKVKPAAQVAAGDTAFWNSALATGVLALAVPAAPVLALDAAAIGKSVVLAAPATGYRLVLSRSRTIGDGTWLNNPWLNELPEPVSKITWDNYLAVSPADATREGWKDGEVVAVTANGTTLKLPVHVQDGQHPGTLETFLGWGRVAAGQVARLCLAEEEGGNGFSVNAYRFVASQFVGSFALTATVTRTGATYHLANVQGHHRLEGRDEIARDRRFGESEPAEHAGWVAGTDRKPNGRLSLWGSSHAYPGHRWGMAVDMNACTGCNACITACTAENNVPVVGRDEVRKNREMHWIRIDRYYRGDEQTRLDVEVVNQPVMCQQCENAPCEVVCPANATMHNEQGQNIMVYNRCIGTRYCANNCPYKVRRFNWYEYSAMRAGPHASGNQLERVAKNVLTSGSVTSSDELTHAPLQMLLNPDVTVRSKGVMEKCNLCVQRTRAVREQEKRTNRKWQDGTITTACAQTCPTKAITFGDLNDPFSGVVTTAKKAEDRGYLLLDEELNTRPGIIYLARLRNRPAETAESPAATAPGAAHE